MKRVFALVIALCLMLPVLPGVAEEKKLHLLWDIPFDTPIQEFIELAYEKAGIVYEVASEEGDAVKLRNVKSQEITFFSYPVKESFARTEGRHAGIKSISFFMEPYEATDDSYSNLLDQTDTILTQFIQAYGALEYGFINYRVAGTVPPSKRYQYPLTEDGRVDREKLAYLLNMVNQEQIEMLHTMLIWDNIVVILNYEKDSNYTGLISQVAMSWMNTTFEYDRIPLDPMPQKDPHLKIVENIDLGL